MFLLLLPWLMLLLPLLLGNIGELHHGGVSAQRLYGVGELLLRGGTRMQRLRGEGSSSRKLANRGQALPRLLSLRLQQLLLQRVQVLRCVGRECCEALRPGRHAVQLMLLLRCPLLLQLLLPQQRWLLCVL